MTYMTALPASLRGNPVRWIHPSYRDMVIEQLSIDKSLRSQFLELMNFAGLKLAVSQAGGKGGDRSLPLLVSDEDWTALARRSLELLADLDVQGSVSILRVLRSATVDVEGKNRTRLLEILGKCCDAIRISLDASHHSIKEIHLRELFEATVLIDPLPVLPQLGPTWKAASHDLRATIKDAIEKSISLDAGRVDEWARLAELLGKNEPRFMRQANFPEAFVGDVTQLMGIVEGESELEIEFEDPEELMAEANRMATLEKALKVIADLFPPMRDSLTDLCSSVSSQEDYLREQYREAQPDADEGHIETEERGASVEILDVDALFVDL